jgi:hypothetical protein
MKNLTAARSSSIGTFSTIVRENYQKLLVIESQQEAIQERLDKSDTDENKLAEFELLRLENEAWNCAVIVIVFSAIAIEAYIFDYAARNLSDAYVQNYLDKLDPLSKWVVIPQLVTGKELPRGQRWFELTKRLIQQRNSIIHYKSSSPPSKYDDAIAYYKKLQHNSGQIYSAAKEALELFDLLMDGMKNIDPKEIVWIDSYLAPNSDNPFKFLEDQ